MTASYTLILHECAEAHRPRVGQFLGRAFSLKETTCATIVASAPIALLSDLSPDESAAVYLMLSSLQGDGVVLLLTVDVSPDLPKIDWPRRPLLFKRDLAEYVADLRFAVPCPDCNKAHTLLALVHHKLTHPHSGSTSSLYRPQEVPGTVAPARVGSSEFKGRALSEITPFSSQSLAEASSMSAPAKAGTAAASDDPTSRLNELFPDDDTPGFVPNTNDITSILNRLLPDEDGATNTGSVSAITADAHAIHSAQHQTVSTASFTGFSVFLAKIGDEARRAKAVPLIAELAKIPLSDAEQLSRKVIIPVVKGASKEEAELAKQRFAKIGILARVKGNETISG